MTSATSENIALSILDDGALTEALSPEKRFLLAILADAILQASPVSRAYVSPSEMNELYLWFSSDHVSCDEESGISFAFICEQFNFDPKEIRRRVITRSVDAAAISRLSNHCSAMDFNIQLTAMGN